MKFSCIIIFFILIFNLSNNLVARDFHIAGIPGEPVRFYNKEKKLTGIDVEIIDEAMKRLGLKYKITLIRSSARLEVSWLDPNVDMIFTYSYNKKRAKHLIYPKQSHITLSWHFFILTKNKEKFYYRTFNDFKGMTIGATKGFSYTPEFWQASKKGIFEIDITTKNDLNFIKLLAGRFDTFPNAKIDTLYQAKKRGYLDKITYLPKPLKRKKYYNTFVKISNYPGLDKIIKRYDRVLFKMKKSGIVKKIINKYIGNG